MPARSRAPHHRHSSRTSRTVIVCIVLSGLRARRRPAQGRSFTVRGLPGDPPKPLIRRPGSAATRPGPPIRRAGPAGNPPKPLIRRPGHAGDPPRAAHPPGGTRRQPAQADRAPSGTRRRPAQADRSPSGTRRRLARRTRPERQRTAQSVVSQGRRPGRSPLRKKLGQCRMAAPSRGTGRGPPHGCSHSPILEPRLLPFVHPARRLRLLTMLLASLRGGAEPRPERCPKCRPPYRPRDAPASHSPKAEWIKRPKCRFPYRPRDARRISFSMDNPE